MVQATTVTFGEMPATIQSCWNTTCSVNTTSSYSSASVSAFQINRFNGNSQEQDWLVRYTLAPPSSQYNSNIPQTDALSGYLWLLANNSYSASESAHPLTLYLDKVTPTPFSMYGQSGDLSLAMTTADLVAGSAYRTWGIDYNNNSYTSGDLTGSVPVPCLSQGCETGARLNLAQLTYGDFGSNGVWFMGFNAADSRSLVFSQYSSYQDGSNSVNYTQSFDINAVPLPGALGLFGSGLLGLVGVMRGVRRHYRAAQN